MTEHIHAMLSDNFYRNPEKHRQRIERKQLKALLLANEPVMSRGNLYDIQHKHVGLGVYEIWLKQRTYS